MFVSGFRWAAREPKTLKDLTGDELCRGLPEPTIERVLGEKVSPVEVFRAGQERYLCEVGLYRDDSLKQLKSLAEELVPAVQAELE